MIKNIFNLSGNLPQNQLMMFMNTMNETFSNLYKM